MNQREKILASVVGSLVLLIVLGTVVGQVRGLFDWRNDRVVSLQQENGRHQRAIREGLLAAKRLDAYGQQSLPGERTLARSLYQEWLLERAVQAGFEGVNVSPLPGKPNGELFYQHSFLVNGEGDLKEVTQFLFGLESTPYLHRVSRLTAKPVAKSKGLDLSITIDALSLNNAPNDKKLDRPASAQLTHGDLSHYVDCIVRRNFFSLANKPPEFVSLGSKTGYLKQPLRIQLSGRDPDKDDKLSYSVEGESLPGARIDEKSGQFEWTPDKLGEYQIAVRVTDNGLPAKSQTETLKISVVDPPPPPAPQVGFDAAQQSILTGITEIAGKRQAWITVRTEGRVLKVFEGDPVAVGTIKGIVSRIDSSQAEIKTEAGQVLTVALGKSLLAAGAAPSANL